jgi:hypothetical protein
LTFSMRRASDEQLTPISTMLLSTMLCGEMPIVAASRSFPSFGNFLI